MMIVNTGYMREKKAGVDGVQMRGITSSRQGGAAEAAVVELTVTTAPAIKPNHPALVETREYQTVISRCISQTIALPTSMDSLLPLPAVVQRTS